MVTDITSTVYMKIFYETDQKIIIREIDKNSGTLKGVYTSDNIGDFTNRELKLVRENSAGNGFFVFKIKNAINKKYNYKNK